jgi:hypothetical protein
VILRIGVGPPEGIRAVTLKKRFEFQRQRLAQALRQHEIHVPFHDANLSRRLKPKHILAKRGEKVFGGGFGLGAVLQVEQIFFNGLVSRKRARIRCRRRKFDVLTLGEFLNGNKYVVGLHWKITAGGIVSGIGIFSSKDAFHLPAGI